MRSLVVAEKNGVLIVVVDDAATLNEGQAVGLRQSLYSLLEQNKPARLALNLSAIDYISSTGIALLVGTQRRVEFGGGHLILFGLQSDVHELFRVMKLVNLFEIVADEDQAVELLSPPPSH